MNSTIILIGPMSAGKSTIGGLLAEELTCPRYSLDKTPDETCAEILQFMKNERTGFG